MWSVHHAQGFKVNEAATVVKPPQEMEEKCPQTNALHGVAWSHGSVWHGLVLALKFCRFRVFGCVIALDTYSFICVGSNAMDSASASSLLPPPPPPHPSPLLLLLLLLLLLAVRKVPPSSIEEAGPAAVGASASAVDMCCAAAADSR